MRRLFGILCMALAMVLSLPALSPGEPCRVVRVVDGDTVVVDRLGVQEKVRFLCVDTPESVHPDQRRNTPMGKAASDFTRGLLAGRFVDLEFEERARGKYGRLLAYIFLGERNINLELVRLGLSPYYTKYGESLRYDAAFRASEALARAAGLNIWGDPDLTERILEAKVQWRRTGIPEKKETPTLITSETGWVGNASSLKFHRVGCPWAAKISPRRIVRFASPAEALNRGFSPCMVCNPHAAAGPEHPAIAWRGAQEDPN